MYKWSTHIHKSLIHCVRASMQELLPLWPMHLRQQISQYNLMGIKHNTHQNINMWNNTACIVCLMCYSVTHVSSSNVWKAYSYRFVHFLAVSTCVWSTLDSEVVNIHPWEFANPCGAGGHPLSDASAQEKTCCLPTVVRYGYTTGNLLICQLQCPHSSICPPFHVKYYLLICANFHEICCISFISTSMLVFRLYKHQSTTRI